MIKILQSSLEICATGVISKMEQSNNNNRNDKEDG